MLKKKGITKWFKLALKIIGILFICFLIYFIWAIIIPTPPIDNHLSLSQYTRVKVAPNYYKVGKCWLKKNKYGIWEMYLEGKPYERGLIYGILSKELMEKQEDAFVNQINEMVPNKFYRFFLKMFVGWFNRDLNEYIPQENLTEIYGVSKSFSSKYDYIAPKYYRILNYHAAHDIGHALVNLNMVACSSFAVKGNLSADSSLIIARNFDFYVGDEFAKNKLIIFVKPSKGYGFASYAWAGLTGVVSGMNEKGLTVTLNASTSDIPFKAKDPISLLAREILQYASNISEAVAIAKKRETFVSESLLIGSAADHKAIIIEKSPSKMDIYDAKNSLITCTNHYQGSTFLKDSVNILNIKNSDSKYRFDRIQELVNEEKPLTLNKIVGILRNKKGIHNNFLGYGNSKSLNQLIAYHSVIFKPNQRLMWISTPPYQLGSFICYDLNTIFNPKGDTTLFSNIDSLTIPPDKFLKTNDFKKYQLFEKIKHHIQKKVMLNIPFPMNEKMEAEFIKTNPDCYVTYMVLGEYEQKLKHFKRAISYYKTALNYNVSSKDEETLIKHKIQDCENKLKEE